MFGTVYSDANGNGVIDTGGPVGTNDVGVAGVKVTLRDTSITDPADPNYGGWSVVTSATGAWNFPLAGAWAGHPGPFTVTVDTTGVDGDTFEPQTSGNWSAVPGSAEQAVSAPFAWSVAPLGLDELLTPVWGLTLNVPNDPSGWHGLNVLTGAAPWDGDTLPGHDDSPSNDVIRSGDSLVMNWTVTAAASTVSLGDRTGPVVLEQTVTLQPGAVVTFARLPGMCVTGGTPLSRIVAQPSNTVVAAGAAPPAGTTSLVLTCNLGDMGTAAGTPSGFIVPVTLLPLGTSAADSLFSTSARVYAVDARGAAVATPAAAPVSPGPFTITSAPRFDIEKRPVHVGFHTYTPPGSTTPISTYYISYRVLISTDRRTGIEALQNPITVTEDFWAQTPNVAGNPEVANLTWYLASCTTINTTDTAYFLNSSLGYVNDQQGLASVTQSGTCSVTARAPGDTTSPVTLTFSGVDTSGAHFPTRTIGGADLSAGPFYVAAYTVQIEVPTSEIDAADGPVPNNTGTLGLYNQLTGFDPTGVSGEPNYGAVGGEPGYCPPRASGAPHAQCALMPNGTRSDNVTGPANVNYPSAGGAFDQYVLSKTTGWSSAYAYLPSAVSIHDGAGAVAPGSVYMAYANLTDNLGGATPFDLSQPTGICTVFDNRVARLAPLAQATGLPAAQAAQLPPNLYAMVIVSSYTGNQATQQPLQSLFKFQYGVADLSGDVSNNGVFDAASGRYGGVWTAQSNIQCYDGAPNITWYDSVAAVPGGVDAVNAVRMFTDPAVAPAPGTVLTESLRFEIGLQQRDTYYNAGSLTGAAIPTGTVMAVFGRPLLARVAAWANWLRGVNTYVPQPENGAVTGDRWTVVRATGSLTVETVSAVLNGSPVGDGVAGVGVVGSAQAGRPVVWRVNAGFVPAPGTPTEGTVDNTKITVTLPVGVTYNRDLTIQLSGGTPADSVVRNADGTTTLTWDLGVWPLGTAIPPRLVYTDTDPMAASGTAAVVTGVLSSSSVPPVPAMTNTHTVVLDQPGSVQVKLATDGTLYLADTPQAYTATVRNFSQSLSIQNPVVYDELPSLGDGSSTVAGRFPASGFAGTARLSGPVSAVDLNGAPVAGTVYYWTCAPADMPQRPEVDTAALAPCWQTAAQLGGDLSTASGWKFVSAAPLTMVGTPGSVLTLRFGLQPVGDVAGDLFANRFTAFSDTLEQAGVYQVLASNETLVGVLGFSLGDLVWIDIDYDGKFTPGVDLVAPAGVTVQVYDAADRLVASTVTDANGRWIVNSLAAQTVTAGVASGSYYALIPASQFAPGGLLYGYRVSVHNSQPDPDTDLNENVDHNAIAGVGGSVRTPLITLRATVNPATRVVTGGLEPLGDNVKGLVTPALVGDDYTNLTLDFALEGVFGTFQVTKAWTGAEPAWPGGEPTYTGSWGCTRAGATVASGTWSQTGTGDAAMVSVFGPAPTEIPTGSVCSALENASSAALFPSPAWSWNGPVYSPAVTIATDSTGRVTVTNSASEAVGDFVVVKAWSGPIPAWVGATVFTGTWACQNLAEGIDATGAWSVTGIGSATLHGLPAVLPAGTMCSAGEDVDGAGLPAVVPPPGWKWADATVDPSDPSDVQDGVPVVVTVTNSVSGYMFSKLATPPGGPVAPGGAIVYTLLGENTGDTPLAVAVDDDLAGVLAHAVTVGDPVVTVLGGVVPPVVPAASLTGDQLAWDGSLEPGEKVQIVYEVQVNQEWGVTLVNAAASTAQTPNRQLLTGQGAVTHTTPLRQVAHTGGTVWPGPDFTAAGLWVLTGLLLLAVVIRRRIAHP